MNGIVGFARAWHIDVLNAANPDAVRMGPKTPVTEGDACHPGALACLSH
jgi:hypothetical protein